MNNRNNDNIFDLYFLANFYIEKNYFCLKTYLEKVL